MTRKYGKILGTLAVMALLVLGATAVFAQSDSTTTPAPTAPNATQDGTAPAAQPDNQRQPGGQHRQPGGQRGFLDPETRDQVIADTLGISVDELAAAQAEGTRLPDLAASLGVDMADVQTALQDAEVTAINQAVANGTLTQEEADDILARMELHTLIDSIFTREMEQEATANALGITVAELQAAQADGQRLPDLAAELGVDMADVRTAVETARADAFAQAVASGLITQEQADMALSHGGQPSQGRPPQGQCPGGQGPLPESAPDLLPNSAPATAPSAPNQNA